jgi:hypothetical protein
MKIAPFTLIFGAMLVKEHSSGKEILFPIAEHVIATRADNPRQRRPNKFARRRRASQLKYADAASVSSALAYAKTLARLTA